MVLLSPSSECVVPPFSLSSLLDVQTPPSRAAANANVPEGDAEKRPAMKGGRQGGRRALGDQRAGSGIVGGGGMNVATLQADVGVDKRRGRSRTRPLQYLQNIYISDMRLILLDQIRTAREASITS